MLKFIAFIGFLVGFVFPCLSQSKPTVKLIVSSKQVETGEPVLFTVKSSISGTVELDYPTEFIVGSGVSSGMEQETDYSTGESITTYYFAQNGTFSQEGSYTIKAYVKKGKVYSSNSVTIRVSKSGSSSSEDLTRKTLKQPIFGLIDRSQTKIYEGEPLILSAKTFTKLNVTMLEGYQPFQVEGGAETFDIDQSQRLVVSEEMLKGHSFHAFTYGKQIVFPSKTGKLTIRPYEMSLRFDNGSIFSESITFRSQASQVEVLPLPENAPNDFIGGVGEFSLHIEPLQGKANAGEIMSFKVIVSGYGNIHNIDNPLVKLPKGVAFYGDPEIKKDISYSNRGTEGSITFTYFIQFQHGGRFTYPSVTLSYFHPKSKKYIQLKGKKQEIDVEGDQKSVLAEANPLHENQDSVTNTNQSEENPLATLKIENPNQFKDSLWFWPMVVSPILFAGLAFVFFKRKKESHPEKSCHSIASFPKTAFEQQIKQLQLELSSSTNVQESYTLIQKIIHQATCLVCESEHVPFSKQSILDMLQAKNKSITSIDVIWKNCDLGKYGFMEEVHLLNDTKNLLRQQLGEWNVH